METQDFPKTLEQIDSHLLAFTAERRRTELLEACERTVRSLELFAAQARRDLESAATEPSRVLLLPGKLLNACAWGSANAATELSCATTIVAEYMRAAATLEERNKTCTRRAP